MKPLDVCVVGELNLDLILYGLPRELVSDRELLADGLSLTLGSSAAIFAHNLSMLGSQVAFVSMVGNDPLGKIALDRLAAAGVDVKGIKQGVTGTFTGLTVILPHQQHRYILTYPGTMFEFAYSDIDMGQILSARHLHLASFFLHRALRPRISDLFREVKQAGLTTSLDTNDDPEDKWEADLQDVFQYVDILFVNEREAKKMTHSEDHEAAINILADQVRIVAVKRGAAASLCRSGKQQFSSVPPKIAVVDDVGAGDSFAAGFIHRYLRGAGLEDCLAFANLAGAYSTTQAGGTEAFRDRDALAHFIAKHATASIRE